MGSRSVSRVGTKFELDWKVSSRSGGLRSGELASVAPGSRTSHAQADTPNNAAMPSVTTPASSNWSGPPTRR